MLGSHTRGESLPDAHVDAENFAHVDSKGVFILPIPPDAKQEEQAFAADITSLERRAHHALRWKSAEWEEVSGLLANAANAGLAYRDMSQGALIYAKADAAFRRHVESKNRFTYLMGALLGIAEAGALASTLYRRHVLHPGLHPPGPSVADVPFAGIGSVTSILIRLNSIDLSKENSRPLITVSGASKPIVAVCFAIVVYLILDLKIVDIQFGAPTEANGNFVFLISSFPCGFSERFAQDILSRVSSDPKPPAT